MIKRKKSSNPNSGSSYSETYKPDFPLVDDVNDELNFLRAGWPAATEDEICARFEEWYPELFQRLLSPNTTIRWVLRIRAMRESGELPW
jgi:hypothetical protein